MKRLLAFLLALCLLLSLPMAATAHDVPQDRNDCTIEVIVRYNGKDISGGNITAIKLGYIDEYDGNYFFRQVITDQVLEDVSSSAALEAMEQFYEDNRDTYDFFTQTQPVKAGKASFSELSTGLYLMVQEKAAYGYAHMRPFLISVPYMDNGVYQYHITAVIKSQLEREVDPTEPPPPIVTYPTLPQTGQLNWPIPMMVVAGLAFFVVGWVLCFRKKKENYAE